MIKCSSVAKPISQVFFAFLILVPSAASAGEPEYSCKLAVHEVKDHFILGRGPGKKIWEDTIAGTANKRAGALAKVSLSEKSDRWESLIVAGNFDSTDQNLRVQIHRQVFVPGKGIQKLEAVSLPILISGKGMDGADLGTHYFLVDCKPGQAQAKSFGALLGAVTGTHLAVSPASRKGQQAIQEDRKQILPKRSLAVAGAEPGASKSESSSAQ